MALRSRGFKPWLLLGLRGLALGAACTVLAAQALTPSEQLSTLSAQAGSPPSAARGQQFFTSKHGKDWACASCHTTNPTQSGQHAATGKTIGPMAPAFNPERFTDAAKTEKWFRRNCNDVVGRECSASEKADVLAWLLSFQR